MNKKCSHKICTIPIGKLNDKSQSKSLKPTVTRVTPFADKAKPTPRYGSLVPPFGQKRRKF